MEFLLMLFIIGFIVGRVGLLRIIFMGLILASLLIIICGHS